MSEAHSFTTFEEAFNRVLPYYMSIGMSVEEFWEGHPRLVRVYREAQRYKEDRKNQELWLQGLYIYRAFASVIAGAFGKRGSEKIEYFPEPLDLHPERDRAKKEQEKARLARKKMVDALNAMKDAWDAKQMEQKNGIESNS